MKHYLHLTFFIVFTTTFSNAQFAEKSKDFQKFNGYFNFEYDDKTDKIYLEVEDLEKEFLYVSSLSSGIGSNDIGLDRGQLGGTRVIFFRKAGNKLLLVQPNLTYRALTDNELERKSVEQAFAKSILGGFKIEEEKDGKYIIDITDFLMQDTHGVVGRLKRNKQGTYKLDKAKSAMALERTKAFPKNIEFDVTLTFKGDPTGANIRSVTPNPGLVTVAQHHSFIELPDDGYKQREFDPRSGASPFMYYDYATPVESPILKRFIRRHRLEKKDPTAAVSEAVEPIIYYLDNGTPEPVRSALLEGGRWWNQAFEAIGYKDAFQVKMLPDDADPLDVRYNVIQWVHRSTRGWSYGASVTDPRTGEIMKGHVSLGSLRIRQDFLIAQALMNKPYAERDDNHQPMLDMAIARIRQLSAHEIGHTLGFAHNYAASTIGRASVMDYPHPQFSIKNGEIDFSNAYDDKIGPWDKVSVAYSYKTFPKGADERKGLNLILEKSAADGLRFITDQDARPQGGAHVLAHLWDNGQNVSQELDAMLKIRDLAISNFSIDNIPTNQPNSVLEDVFAPLYFFHRYQTEAVANGLMFYGMDPEGYYENGSSIEVKVEKNNFSFVLTNENIGSPLSEFVGFQDVSGLYDTKYPDEGKPCCQFPGDSCVGGDCTYCLAGCMADFLNGTHPHKDYVSFYTYVWITSDIDIGSMIPGDFHLFGSASGPGGNGDYFIMVARYRDKCEANPAYHDVEIIRNINALDVESGEPMNIEIERLDEGLYETEYEIGSDGVWRIWVNPEGYLKVQERYCERDKGRAKWYYSMEAKGCFDFYIDFIKNPITQ